MIRHGITIGGAALLGAFAALAAQSPTAPSTPLPAYRGRLLGVYNSQTGEPIEGAEVIDALSKTKALTTKTGTVSLVFLPDGGSMVRVQKIGFRPMTTVIAISSADTVPMTIVLDPVATTLPTVVTRDSSPRYISPALRAFDERRRQGFGYFITDSILRKNDSQKMTSIVRTLPNVHLVCPPLGFRRAECWATSARSGCAPDLYIDGVRVTDNDLEKLPVNQFAGVEYYAGGATIPPQYNRTGSCSAVLLFWTRER